MKREMSNPFFDANDRQIGEFYCHCGYVYSENAYVFYIHKVNQETNFGKEDCFKQVLKISHQTRAELDNFWFNFWIHANKLKKYEINDLLDCVEQATDNLTEHNKSTVFDSLAEAL